MSYRQTGIVKWFDEKQGIGFITANGGPDIFVHYKDIRSDGFQSLKEGQKVSFIPTPSEKGMLAKEVEVM
jgi:CspA family cold shock protein